MNESSGRQTNRPIIICITAQSACENIIRTGTEMAKRMGTKAEVITVQPKKMEASRRSETMKSLYDLSKKTNMEITIYYSDHPVNRISQHAIANDAMHILTGMPDKETEFISMLSIMSEDIPVSMVGGQLLCTLPSAMSIASAKRA